MVHLVRPCPFLNAEALLSGYLADNAVVQERLSVNPKSTTASHGRGNFRETLYCYHLACSALTTCKTSSSATRLCALITGCLAALLQGVLGQPLPVRHAGAGGERVHGPPLADALHRQRSSPGEGGRAGPPHPRAGGADRERLLAAHLVAGGVPGRPGGVVPGAQPDRPVLHEDRCG